MWSFLVASVVLVVITGPDQALITRNAFSAGRRAGLATAAIFGVTYLAWFTFYVACVDRCANWLRRHRVRRTIERATAGALVSFAARVALERR